jgi:hypothetical protein
MRRFTTSVLCALLWSSAAFAGDGESSFTPSSLYVPIRNVLLINTSSNLTSALYRCPSEPDQPPPPNGGSGGASAGTGGAGGAPSTIADDGDAGIAPEILNDDCLVDMADNAALAALFSGAIDIEPGSYDAIVFNQCRAGAQGYSSYVKGKISLSGQTWYTTSGSGSILTTARADNRHVQIDYSGCSSVVKLPHAVTLAAGAAMNISAFFSLRNIAWATLTSNGPPGGCAFDANSHNVCTGYPIPIAYLGSDSPSLQTYYVTEDQSDLNATKAGGQLLLLRTSEGLAFGGFSRRLYSAHSVNPSVNYDTPIKTLMLNADGMSYLIENWGGGSNGVSVPYYVHFPAFELQTHNGTFTRSDGVTTVDYRAVLQ